MITSTSTGSRRQFFSTFLFASTPLLCPGLLCPPLMPCSRPLICYSLLGSRAGGHRDQGKNAASSGYASPSNVAISLRALVSLSLLCLARTTSKACENTTTPPIQPSTVTSKAASKGLTRTSKRVLQSTFPKSQLQRGVYSLVQLQVS